MVFASLVNMSDLYRYRLRLFVCFCALHGCYLVFTSFVSFSLEFVLRISQKETSQ